MKDRYIEKRGEEMLRFLDAGESHGRGLCAVLEGLPANFPIKIENINKELARRQKGYGRGGRMKIEKDTVEIISGLNDGMTTGGPVTLLIQNRDYENWRMKTKEETFVTIPRPGHADLTGEFKYATGNLRNSIERSSARETAIRTAVGAVCKEILRELGIEVRSKVQTLYGLTDTFCDLFDDGLYQLIEKSPMRVLRHEEEFMALVDSAKKNGDTLGGWVYASCEGVMKGLGSFMQYDRRLDGILAGALMSIQGVKQVSIGNPFYIATGVRYQDGITYEDGKLTRTSNHAGGIEGGISNGEALEVYCYMKPIPSTLRKLPSVDLATRENTDSRYERSDVTAVVPLSIVVEHVLAFELLKEILNTFSRDNKEELLSAIEVRKERIGEIYEKTTDY